MSVWKNSRSESPNIRAFLFVGLVSSIAHSKSHDLYMQQSYLRELSFCLTSLCLTLQYLLSVETGFCRSHTCQSKIILLPRSSCDMPFAGRGKDVAQCLRQYRAMHPEKRGNDAAKLMVCAFSSTGFSIADPQDAGMLDVAGFDSALPEIMEDFVLGGQEASKL